MARITRAAFHVSIEEVKERMNNDPRPMNRKRWLIIYNALIEPREAKDIARHTGVSVATVHQVISTYNRLGVAAVETPGKGGRRHEYMTVEEERELLTPFFELAQKGELTTIAPIKQAFEKRVGHEVDAHDDLPTSETAPVAKAGATPFSSKGRSRGTEAVPGELCHPGGRSS
jgi:transposase